MHDHTLLELLQSDLTNTGKLESLLKVEREHLENRDIDCLNATLGEKSQILARLEKNEQQRRELLNEAGYSKANQKLAEFYATLQSPFSEKCTETFEELKQIIEKCKLMNDVNGAIVRRSKSSSAQVLSILRGQMGNPDLYTNLGDTDTHNQSRPIAKA